MRQAICERKVDFWGAKRGVYEGFRHSGSLCSAIDDSWWIARVITQSEVVIVAFVVWSLVWVFFGRGASSAMFGDCGLASAFTVDSSLVRSQVASE